MEKSMNQLNAFRFFFVFVVADVVVAVCLWPIRAGYFFICAI